MSISRTSLEGIEPCPTYGITTAYANRACRCVVCKNNERLVSAAYRLDEDSATSRQVRIGNRAHVLAGAWVRKNHPEVWRDLRKQARHELGLE